MKLAAENYLPAQTIAYLADIYGSRIYSVLDYVDKDARMADSLTPEYPDIRAQIKHAVLEEEALTINDFLFRRSLLGLGHTRGQSAVEEIAKEMALLLKWSDTEKQNQLRDYQSAISISQNSRKGGI